jgi:hypothetical protein
MAQTSLALMSGGISARLNLLRSDVDRYAGVCG